MYQIVGIRQTLDRDFDGDIFAAVVMADSEDPNEGAEISMETMRHPSAEEDPSHIIYVTETRWYGAKMEYKKTSEAYSLIIGSSWCARTVQDYLRRRTMGA